MAVLGVGTTENSNASIDSSSEGTTGHAGNITVIYGLANSGTSNFVVDGTATGTVNGAQGMIWAKAMGSGNGGAVTIINNIGDVDVTLNDNIQCDIIKRHQRQHKL